jgi:hypothetical protein
VIAVLVLVAEEILVRAEPPDVQIVGRTRLRRWLEDHPTSLDDARVAQLSELARREATWRAAGA